MNKILHNQQVIMKAQANMQTQIDSLRQTIENGKNDNDKQSKQDNIMENMIRENLVIAKQTYKTTKRFFGENVSPLEEEMGSFLPLSELSELNSLEARLQNLDDEAAMVVLSKYQLLCTVDL